MGLVSLILGLRAAFGSTPNPTADLVRWPLPLPVAEASLVDRLGRLVMGPEYWPVANVLDLSSLPDGLYLLRLRTTNHIYHHARIIKQTRP